MTTVIKSAKIPNHGNDVIEVAVNEEGLYDITWYFNNGEMTDWDRWEMTKEDALDIYNDVVNGLSNEPHLFTEIAIQCAI